MEHVMALLHSIAPLSDKLDQRLRELLKPRKYLKRESLLKEGKVCPHMWFIESGIVGCFYEKSDKALCAWFMKENDVTTSVTSFFQQVPSPENIVALDDTVTWSVTFSELQSLYRDFPELNYHGRLLTQQYYILAEWRMRAFYSMPPLEKYKYLVAHQPEIVQRVSVKDLARFIGIHPDALSRVRARV